MYFDKKSKTAKTSFIIGLSFTTIGLIFTLLDLTSLGMAFFFFLPLAIGISSGILPEPKQAIAGTLISLVVFSVFLLFSKLEGIICVLLAIPILIAAILIGWLIGRLIRHYHKKDDEPNLKLSFAPFLIFLVANLFELFSGGAMMPAAVQTSMTLNASPTEIYDAIIAVDTVDLDKNTLQILGLPTPRKCILTEEKIGGKRICLFEEGQIIETIVALEKDKLLLMEVSSCELGERSWLQFDQDRYDITALPNGQTEISRTTTYSSNLRPRKYWELMEHLTIASEQDFVFQNLKKQVENAL